MDVIAPITEVSEELIRDSLIAISNLLPDSSSVANERVPDSLISTEHIPEVVSSPNHSKDDSSAANLSNLKDGGEIEYHRSELISLSYTQPPEAHPLPSSRENIKS